MARRHTLSNNGVTIMRLILTIAAFWTIASSSLAGPDSWVIEWPNTDFGNTSVESWVEILSGGPTKDGIPALSDPEFRNFAMSLTGYRGANLLLPLKSKELARALIQFDI